MTSGQATLDLLLATPGLACATIKVPRDWHHPRNGKTFDVRISKTRTAEPGPGRQGIALVNPGGPGGEGLPWGAAMALRAPELAKRYDFIGFDPRGVGQSSHTPCTITVDDARPPTSQWEVAKVFADGCRRSPDTQFMTTEQTAYDMDFIRVLLGEQRTSFIGYSYGTWLGTWYAATFPRRVHRMLLDSATDVSTRSLQHTWDLQPMSRERAFQEQLMAYVARHDDAYHLGTDPVAVRKRWETAGGTRGVLGSVMSAIFILPAMYDTTEYPTAATVVAAVVQAGEELGSSPSREVVAAAIRGIVARQLRDGTLTADERSRWEQGRDNALVALDRLARSPLDRALGRVSATGVTTEQADMLFELIRCQDGQWNQSARFWLEEEKRINRTAPFYGPLVTWLGYTPTCAAWPTTNRMPRVDARTFPKVMIAQAELDVATAYEGALASSRHLPGAHMISVDNEGSHGVFPYGTTCVDDPVQRYFLTGILPDHRYTVCGAVPLPGEQQTYDVAGTMGPRGTLRLKAMSREQRQINRFVRDMLSGQVIDPVTGQPIPQ
ncbi:alpha/beta hydrolase [Terrabacter sp. NPDC000476]|uniref:alpha/beta hydrolase n=1 Tax=Terrabacter sp. NPDC000476 TaxID=3154258 RepID=UPI00332531EF